VSQLAPSIEWLTSGRERGSTLAMAEVAPLPVRRTVRECPIFFSDGSVIVVPSERVPAPIGRERLRTKTSGILDQEPIADIH